MKKSVLAALILMPTLAFGGVNVKEELKLIDSEKEACLAKEENQNTMGMKICTSDAFGAASIVLSRLIAEQKASLGVKTGDEIVDRDNAVILKRLEASQKAWKTHREANAELQGTIMLGGTGEGLVIGSTMYEMTKERAIELDELLNSDL